ncbi:MAG: hypothetical protein IIY21_21110, partial [Clostridiales bacterium]|nr:hypothetical protein [Clostridiales bacterium]
MQNLNVNITPDNYPQSLYYSQNDVGREFKINITDFTIPTGATVKIQATKPSGFGFSVAGTVSGNSVTFETTAEMTDEAGRFPAELVVTSGTDVIGTANFLMVGEMNPHPEGTTDGSQGTIIPELTLLVERVEAAASSVLDMQVVAQTLPAGSQASYSYDEDLNKATFGIPEGQAGAGAAGVVASAYSAAKTYKVGDYVLYNSNLYRCTTAITTAEAWTAAHWTQIVLADDVTDLKTDFNKLPNPLFSCGINDLPLGASGILSIKLNEQTQSIPDGTELYLWFFQEANGSKYFYIKTGSNGVMSPDAHDICSAIVDNTQGDFIGTYTTRPYASTGQNATYYFDVVIDWGKVYKSNTLNLYDHALLNKEAIISGNHYELVADADKIRNDLEAVEKIVSPPIFYEDGVDIPERFKSVLSIKLNEQTQAIPEETDLYLWFVYKDDEQKVIYIKTGEDGVIDGANDGICAWIKDTTSGDFIKQYTTIPYYSNPTYYFDITVDWSKVPNSTEVVTFNNVRLNKDAIINGYDRATYHYIDDKLS